VDKFSLYEMSLLDQKISQVVVKGRHFELNFERQLVSYLGEVLDHKLNRIKMKIRGMLRNFGVLWGRGWRTTWCVGVERWPPNSEAVDAQLIEAHA